MGDAKWERCYCGFGSVCDGIAERKYSARRCGTLVVGCEVAGGSGVN